MFNRDKIKQFVAKTTIYSKWKKLRSERQELVDWEANGRPLPPPPVYKQKMIKAFAENFQIGVFIETGTFLGDTTAAVKNIFKTIYSIEIEPTLYKNAKKRFKDVGNIHVIKGDSGEQITKILKKLNQPAIFWLDAHYSAGVTGRGKEDSPMNKELDVIVQHITKKKFEHVLLLDDARDFWGTNGYPSIAEVMYMVIHKLPGYTSEVKDGIMRIYKPRNGKLERQ